MEKKILIVSDNEGQKELIIKALVNSRSNKGGLVVVDNEKRGEPVKKSKFYIPWIMSMLDAHPFERKIKAPKPIKRCLECGKDHQHNNSWCSPECCKTTGQSKLNKNKIIHFFP